MRTPFLACVALLALAPAGERAAARAEIALSAYTGSSYTRRSDLHLEQAAIGTDATFGQVRWAPRPFSPAPYYGLRVSWFPTSAARFGASFDFTHYKAYARTGRAVPVRGAWRGEPVSAEEPMDVRVQQFEVSHGVNLAALSLVYRQAWGRWRPYGGAGVGLYFPHAEATLGPDFTSADYQAGGVGFQLLAGVEYAVARHWSAFLELKFDAGELDLDFEDGMRASTDLRTLHAVAGIAFSF